MSVNAPVCLFRVKKTLLRFDYTMDGFPLIKLDNTKDLGVLLNSRFSFDDHVISVVNKANAALGFVKRWSKEFDDPYITKLLFCTFVRPILEYASPVWSPYYKVHIDRIEAVQRRFLRFALRGLPWINHLILPPYTARLRLISLNTLEDRRNRSRTVFAFDCLQGTINSPELLAVFNISVPSRSLRSTGFFHIPLHHTNYGMNEPMSSISRHFNLNNNLIDFNLSRRQVKGRLS